MLNIRVDGGILKMKDTSEWFCTLFPNDPEEMPQDFSSWDEAEDFGKKQYGIGNYTIESPC